MKNAKKELNKLTEKLTNEYFQQNPDSERTEADVRIEMRAIAEQQLSAKNAAAVESESNADTEAKAENDGQGESEKSEAQTVETPKEVDSEAVAAAKAIQTMADFEAWFEAFKGTHQLQRKADGSTVVEWQQLKSRKPQHVGILVGFKLSNKKRADVALPYLLRYYSVIEKTESSENETTKQE